jgi:hypothetical protein
MFICLRLNNITTITKEWLHKRISDTYVMSHIQNTQKNGHPTVHHITTVASSSSRNIPNTKLRAHPQGRVYLQPKEYYLYGCGGLPHLYR